MFILLVEPDYYTRYPPLGLLKIAAYHKASGDEVELVRGKTYATNYPDKIYVTSLFTYSWRPVHQCVAFYQSIYPKAQLVLGGIYTTLMPEHAALSGAEVKTGVISEFEGFLPDYSLVPDWKSSIMFSSRGCIRKCAFCAVPRLEKVRTSGAEVKHLVAPGHTKVILWDNNILGEPHWRDVVAELKELGVSVDFNQGLDARLITDDVAQTFKGLKVNPVRMAYDIPSERRALQRAIPALFSAGKHKKSIIVYTLYNFTDSPHDFWQRVADLLSWGVVCYPMRYEPLNSLVKNRYISPHWTKEQLEMVAQARRVIGRGGAFPPYEGLQKKITEAGSFEQAFELRPGPERNPQFAFSGLR